MTLRQVWRFLRDCQVIDQDATIAQFNRIYMQGSKNHYTLLGTDEVSKFNFLYGHKKSGAGTGGAAGGNSILNNDSDDFSEEEEDDAAGFGGEDIEPEDIHDASKVILQR